MANGEWRKRLDQIGAAPAGDGADPLAQQIRRKTEKLARLVKEAKVTID